MHLPKKYGRGFTLTEVLFVLVILGVLAGLAVPSYLGTVEKAREAEATTNLKTLNFAEKIYKVDNAVFFGPSPSIATINSTLNIEIEQQFFDVSISEASASTYEALAQRNTTAGGDGAKCFKVNQTGTVTGPFNSCA
jgi:type IV pilus assembly protein PilA